MALMLSLQPVNTSRSSLASTATVRRNEIHRASNGSLWSTFLRDSPMLGNTERSTIDESTTLPIAGSVAADLREGFRSARSQQNISITPQNDRAEYAVHQSPIAESQKQVCELALDQDTRHSIVEDVDHTRPHSIVEGVDHTRPPSIVEGVDHTRPPSIVEGVDHTRPPSIVDGADGSIESQANTKTFRRWISTLRRRRGETPLPSTTPSFHRWPLDDFDAAPLPNQLLIPRRSHEKSESWTSSSGLLATMKSATLTWASASVAPLSRHTSRNRHGNLHSSLLPESEPRPSIDSQRQMLDEAARHRSRKRRDKIEELIRSEESYVADLKALSNAYSTLLGHRQSSATFARKTAQTTINDMLHLHDDLLGQLQRVIPFAEFDQSVAKAPKPACRGSHTRWHSADGIPEHLHHRRPNLASIRQARRSLSISKSLEHEPIVLHCPPQVVGIVATTFCAYVPRFAAYDSYGAKYATIQRDIEHTQGLIACWPDFDRAIEALSTTLNPVKSRDANRRKALTIKDLLIKPIQRLPRYELLFAELSRLTPVCDDPNAHALIEDLRGQIAEACRAMNNAKENPIHMRTLETTWLLGERLTFSNQVPKAVFLHLLGEVLLCGCLYITYRSKNDFVKGAYMICIMFSTTLVLANITHDEPLRYGVLAGLSLATAVIEETDNGKGLQCHTTPHTCSAAEANIWRSHLGQSITSHGRAVGEQATNVVQFYSPLTAEMKSIGAAFGKPGSFVRRMSVHRSATVGPMTDLNQVIIKNTQAVKESMATASGTWQTIPRSQSTTIPSHVQTLAPRRVDRIRLESMLADVWSQTLPYPGMTVRRTDQIKGSADQIMRKLSIASLTSSFHASKRNGSLSSMTRSHREESSRAPSRSSKTAGYENKKPARLPLSELLPADFELQGQPTRRRNALRALTMTIERPFSPLLGSSNEASLRRAQSVRAQQQYIQSPEPGLMTVATEARGETGHNWIDTDKSELAHPNASDASTVNTPRWPQCSSEENVTSADSECKKPKGKGRLRRLFG